MVGPSMTIRRRVADRPQEIAALVEAALGVGVSDTSRVSGGDVADSFRVVLADGRTVFAKTHRNPPPDFFATEAAGLVWLAEPGTIPVPAVLAVTEAALVLDWIDEGSPRRGTDADFGVRLAALHRTGAPCFGRSDSRTTGSRRLPNDPAPTWAEFYAVNRLLPLAGLAADESALPGAAVERLERLAGRLDELGIPDEPPARLHGDLWAGNRLVDRRGASWLIDPAAHGGHREFDLAMMQLFGGFASACFEAYDETFPLAPGWQARLAVHQLAPLTVHAIKFGGGYAEATVRALEASERL